MSDEQQADRGERVEDCPDCVVATYIGESERTVDGVVTPSLRRVYTCVCGEIDERPVSGEDV